MAVIIFILVLFVFFVGGGWVIGKSIGNLIFRDKEEKHIYIDKSIHHHYHEHKNISIIDDVTKKKIFELKDQN